MTKKNKSLALNNSFTEFLLYTTPNGKVRVEIFLRDENIWLTQAKIAKLFGIQQPAIAKHLKNIFEARELEENSVHSILEYTASDGKKYQTKFYNLDAIISVGYRVNSAQATQFRIWATERLKEYIIKGFTMDDDRLKNGKYFDKDYFLELLERVRSIRTSERKIYQQITDIFAECSIDYNPTSEIAKNFYAMIQNKFHFAITGKTAAEIIYETASKQKPFMGLKTWKQAPKGKILKSDVVVAKNYLNEEHIKTLNALVNSYLDLAESRATNRKVMNMKDWDSYLGQFLELAGHPILDHVGAISMLEAKLKAESEFEQYRVTQDRLYESDFDRLVQNINPSK